MGLLWPRLSTRVVLKFLLLEFAPFTVLRNVVVKKDEVFELLQYVIQQLQLPIVPF